jgi:ATP synthase protein I
LLDLSVSSSRPSRPLSGDGYRAWEDDADEGSKAAVKRLSQDEARALTAGDSHAVRPWRVVAVQAVVGLVVALLCGVATGSIAGFVSALYGAGVVVVPAALMARGMTSPLSSVSPVASAFSVMVWMAVKLGVSLVMLGLAPKVVQPLVWPALLVALVVCIKVYWVALAWRRKN